MVTVLWLKRTGVNFLRATCSPLWFEIEPVWCNFTELYMTQRASPRFTMWQIDEYCEPVHQNWMINVLKEDSFPYVILSYCEKAARLNGSLFGARTLEFVSNERNWPWVRYVHVFIFLVTFTKRYSNCILSLYVLEVKICHRSVPIYNIITYKPNLNEVPKFRSLLWCSSVGLKTVSGDL